MTHRYSDGVLTKNDELPAFLGTFESAKENKIVDLYPVINLMVKIRDHVSLFRSRFEALDVSFALNSALHIAFNGNMTVDRVRPWDLVKQGDKTPVLNAALYSFADSLRVIAILISPVLPNAAHGIFDQLNWKMELSGKEERFSLADAEWGKLPNGHVVGKPVPLFPRIET
jgi:methionyl-tRNA synthetase